MRSTELMLMCLCFVTSDMPPDKTAQYDCGHELVSCFISKTLDQAAVCGLSEFQDPARYSYLMFALRDIRIPRTVLLRRAHITARVATDPRIRKKCANLADILTQMVNEEKADGTSFTRQKATIDQLVFRLRDQQHFEYLIAPPNSPAACLIRRGLAAVPQLIKSLDDHRITRSVVVLGDGEFYILTIGDCAYAILERIAGKRFSSASYLHSETISAQELDGIRRRIRTWWKNAKK